MTCGLSGSIWGPDVSFLRRGLYELPALSCLTWPSRKTPIAGGVPLDLALQSEVRGHAGPGAPGSGQKRRMSGPGPDLASN